jgi:hypothetical protein
MSVLLIVAIVILFPSGGPSIDDNLRSGQAHEHTTAIAIPESIKNNDGQYRSETTEEVRDTIDSAVSEIREEEEKEILKSENTLSAAISTAGQYVRIGLKKLLGSNSVMSEDDINDMVQAVEERLTDEVANELRQKANVIATTEEDNINDNATADNEAGIDVTTIEDSVHENEEAAIEAIRSELGSTADQLQKALRVKAQEAEKQILEDRLSARLGKKVKLTIMDDEIDGVEELLAGLPELKGEKKSVEKQVVAYDDPGSLAIQPNSVSALAFNTGDSSTAAAPPAKVKSGGFDDDGVSN